ncbi:MAG: polysaccharide biosynthesis protein [Bacteroidales bacterium]|nr:polysaccharide biosynthesis protein [Bacteroidales bacterium]
MSMRNNKIIEKIAHTSFIRVLYSTPTPRWITYSADILIVTISTILIFVLLPNEINTFNCSNSYIFTFFLILTAYGLTNLMTGAYKCIVRFSLIDDMLKSFFCVLSATIILLIVNYSFYYLNSEHKIIFSFAGLIIIGIISLCIMILMRMCVKYLYLQFSNLQVERQRTIIWGSDINSIFLAMTLKNEINGRFLPVAFLSTNSKNSQVNGLPIEHLCIDEISNIFNKHNCSSIIFQQAQLANLSNDLINIFINNNIKLLTINKIEEFNQNDIEISHQIKNIRIEDLLGRHEINIDREKIKNFISLKTVLISGAAGSIGSEIVRQVLDMGANRAILIDQAETPMHNLQLEILKKYSKNRIEICIADVKDIKRLNRIFAQYQPDIVFHAAAYKHVPMMESNSSEAILTNVLGTKNLADLSIKHGIDKFVMISTDKAVNPTNIMGASKRLAEIYVQSLNYVDNKSQNRQTKFITTRFGNVLGSNGSVIPLFRQQIENREPITITNKEIIRYFMTIREVCSLVLEAGCMGNGGEIFVFDMGKPIKIYDLAKQMIVLAGLRVNEDIKIIETGLRPGEKLYEELLNDKEKTIATSHDKILIAKVRKYKFTDIEYSISHIIKNAEDGNIHDMIYEIKTLIPEYVSANSEYELIDREINNLKK